MFIARDGDEQLKMRIFGREGVTEEADQVFGVRCIEIAECEVGKIGERAIEERTVVEPAGRVNDLEMCDARKDGVREIRGGNLPGG